MLHVLCYMNLDSPILSLPRVSPAYQKRLAKLGIKTLRDLFYHFPRRYNDFSKITKIIDLRAGSTATVQGQITKIADIRTWKKRMNITEAFIQDKTGNIRAVWFNQPYLANTLKDGSLISLSGKVNLNKDLYFSNPAYEKITNQLRHTGRIVPVYPETAGLSSKYLRYIIQPLLPLTEQIKDWLPEQVKKSQCLIELKAAIRQIHFPASLKSAGFARRRLAFEELFLIQTFTLSQKMARRKEQAQTIEFNETLIRDFVAKLPFQLTGAQKKAAWEIFQDLAKSQPMNRLLEGDVGAGKTVIAAMAALEVMQTGYQTAFMAPTEILAKQHYNTICQLLAGFDIKIGLVTGNDKKLNHELGIRNYGKGEKRSALDSLFIIHNADIVIGTQALIQEKILFKNLALAVVDEQHRFGVAQRAALQKNIADLSDGLPGKIPHLLSMTATPIPRSLALTIYGDLDLSLLDEMPKGRQKIITRLVPPGKRNAAYEFIRQQIKSGRQAFVVCPRIESSDKNSTISNQPDKLITNHLSLITEIKTAKEEYEKISKNIFPDLKIALLHGKVKSKEKDRIMADFAAGQIDILVATSVIEVGLDISNAAIMMVEGAERFGLAQLHQLRGRVGRGAHQSYCLLFTDSASRQTQERLKIMTACHNGFELAEQDLALRGPGEFFGTNQSGLPDLSASLISGSLIDLIMVRQARVEAAKILQQDPELKNYPLLKEKLAQFQKNIHLE
ncbi:MAG: ATP-dependent DNA helicase [Parcubacteria group bacterium GW2011_GWA2_43_9b]|nr:MAG: ATP-dependent DNA helicase [Parcubacteria group bacterium GW2011_GWA2_43_9b]